MRSSIFAACTTLVLCAVLASPASAQQADVAIPDPLQDWIPWVLHGHEELACPLVQGARLCAWPGRLQLDLDEQGGRFELEVRADRELDLPLPGDTTRWPRAVRVDGAGGLLSRSGEVPTVHLAPGTHTVTGSFRWRRLPESLAVPPQIALLTVRVRGEAVAHPRRQADGNLWLQGGQADTTREDQLTLEVHRRVEDGVPVVVTTRLRLRVSGKSREEDLGDPLPAGTEIVALNSTLPARLDGQGHLRVQLRPGDQTITLRARSTGPIARLEAPQADDRWPTEEIWVFAASPAVRAVRLEGAPGVDPQRTSLESDWHGLPTYRVARGGGVDFVELRRGEASPPPDSIHVERELWLVERGQGFIVRDRLNGTVNEGGRLELLAPGQLGHVKVGGQDRVINQAGEGADTGVEIRDGALGLEAELSYPDVGTMPAAGWNRDASSLSARVNLPPGWKIVATTGVDAASGTWIDAWSLLDLFFLLMITLATWKMMSVRWAALALVVLGLAWHEPIVPQAWWLILLALHALVGALKKSWLTVGLEVFRWVMVFGLAIHLLVFAWFQIRHGVFPQLDHDGVGPYSGVYWGGQYDDGFSLGMGGMAPPQSAPGDFGEYEGWDSPAQEVAQLDVEYDGRRGGSSLSWEGKAKKDGDLVQQRAARIDPQAIVQTGPGLPSWQWNSYSLTWNGPVSASHSMRLFLLPPWADLLLSILRVLGLVVLGLRFCDPRRNPRPKPPGDDENDLDEVATSDDLKAVTPSPATAPVTTALFAIGLGLVGLFAAAPAAAEEAPDPALLTELETRLTARPDCGAACLELPRLDLRADGDGLTITARVHAAALTAFPLPGPDSAWLPSRVTVDGVPVLALRRQADGFLALRLTEGIHEVVLKGPARDEISLRFPLVPRVLTWSGDGWTIDGHRPDAPPPPSVQLNRSRPLETRDEGEETVELPPWLELRRELDVGIPWLVHNELRRLGPSGSVVHARVPLLEGESVTTPGIPVEGDVAVVTLEGGETSRSWDSTLTETDSLVLTAPTDRPWLERWDLDCSPIWSCAATGIAPVQHMEAGRWRPAWQPWPGEQVTLSFGKPVPASGATSTVDEASLALSPGRRVLESTLTFKLRSSQGGEQNITIPADGQVVTFTIDGLVLPIQQEGGKLTFSAEPGEHQIQLVWRQDKAPGLVMKAPDVTLSSGGANVLTTMSVPDNKWLLWSGGPRWGAVVTLWQYVMLLILVAFLLGRYAPTDLKTHDWFILGLGMTQVPLAAPVIVVLWLIGVGLRGRKEDLPFWAHDLSQLAVVGGTALAFIMMYWAVYEGLLFQPDMQVEGAGSYGSSLQWYLDRTDGDLARPWVLWAPLWVWRVLMLLWALWLAVKTFLWLKWGWTQFSAGGLWKMPPPGVPEAAAAAVTPSADPEAPAPAPRT
jgi:hypothetical protein